MNVEDVQGYAFHLALKLYPNESGARVKVLPPIGTINRDLIERIKAVQSVEILDGLFDLLLWASSFDEFKEQVLRATDN